MHDQSRENIVSITIYTFHITLIIMKAMRNIGLTTKQSVTSIIYGLKHE